MELKWPKLFLNRFILFFFGFICCSTLSTYISFKLGFPFGVPELLCLLFFPFFYEEYLDFVRVLRSNLIQIFLLFIFLLGIGLLYNNMYSSDVLASSRGYLYIFIFFFYGLNCGPIDINKLFWVSLGAVIGGYLNGLLLSSGFEDETHAYSNLIAFSILVSYPLIKKQNILFMLCLFGALYVAFFSGLRRQIVEIALSCLFSLILILVRDKFRISKILVIVAVFLPSLLLVFINYIEKYFYENNYYLWSRIFLKTEASAQDIDAEGSRAEHAFNLLNYIADTIIPRGIYPRGIPFDVDGSGGSTLDFPLYEIFYVFGSITVLFFVVKYFLFVCRGLKIISNKRNGSNELILMVATSSLLVVSSFFDGSFLQYTFVAPFTGLVIGRMVFLIKKETFIIY